MTLRYNVCIRLGRMISFASAIATLMLTPSQAQEQQPYYAGKTIRLIVGVAAGGGFDAYGRLLAAYLPQFVPGAPSVVVQNMPGAGSVLMANHLYSPAVPRDGTVIGLGGGNLLTAGLFGASGARFDAREFAWIGSMNAEIGVTLAWHTAPISAASEIFEREFVVGGAGLNAASVMFPNVLNRVLGTKFKVVSGYSGSAESMLAMERGEVQGIGYGNYSGIASGKQEWLQQKKIKLLLQYGLKRHEALPDLPTVLELAKTQEQRDVLSLVLTQLSIGRPVLGPPQMGEEPFAILRKAFTTLIRDKQFLAEVARRKMEINQPVDGDDIRPLIAKLYASDPALIKQAAAAVSPTRK